MNILRIVLAYLCATQLRANLSVKLKFLLFYGEVCGLVCNIEAQFSRVTGFSQVVCSQFLSDIFCARSKQLVFCSTQIIFVTLIYNFKLC